MPALFKILCICDLLSRKGLFSGAFGISCRYTSCVWSWEEPDSSTSSTPGDAGLHSDFFFGVFGLVFPLFFDFAGLGFLSREDGCRFLYEACEVPLSNRFVVPKARGFFWGHISTL